MIELRQISKIYASKGGQVPALVDVDLVLPESGLIFVLGKSGCGKTTLLNMIGGLDDPTSGKILVDGKEIGYKTMIQVEPEEAFGEYDPLLVRVEDRELFPTPLEVGMQFEGIPENADPTENPAIYVVTDIADGKVILDGNHPLAGIALRFELTVTDVRAATDKEIERGYVNDPDGLDEDDEGDGQFRSLLLH